MIMTENVPEKKFPSVVWARMHGFAPWPARVASAYERNKVIKPKSKPTSEVTVTFFGTRNDSGWVTETSISPFNAETWQSKFDKKKFKGDKNYRAGILEAVLITRFKGVKYSAEVLEMLNECKAEFQDKMNHLCSVCAGSSLSGDLTTCLYCDQYEVHWHCFQVDDPDIDGKFWVCESCCKVNKLPKGTVITRDNLIQQSLDEEKKYVDSVLKSSNEEIKTTDEPETSSKKKSSKKGKEDEAKESQSSGSNGKSVTKSLLPDSGTIEAPTIPSDNQLEPLEDEVDDNCFICGQEGELLMCDYPDCPRVYHPVCTLKVAPKPLIIDTAMDGYDQSNSTDDNLWYCPKHFCTVCGSIELSPKYSNINQSINLPHNLFIYAKQKQIEANKSNASNNYCSENLWEILNANKQLRSCKLCPFTICNECDNTVAPHTSAFKSKKGNGSKECKNCSNPALNIRLAKILENAWVKMASSRLALPFLRPLLPAANQELWWKPLPTNQDYNKESELDLLRILEHIHALKYSSVQEFEADLYLLRIKIYEKLYAWIFYLSNQKDEGENTSSSPLPVLQISKDEKKIEEMLKNHDLTKAFYLSFETLIESVENFLLNKDTLLQEIEEERKQLQLEEINEKKKRELPSVNFQLNSNSAATTPSAKKRGRKAGKSKKLAPFVAGGRKSPRFAEEENNNTNEETEGNNDSLADRMELDQSKEEMEIVVEGEDESSKVMESNVDEANKADNDQSVDGSTSKNDKKDDEKEENEEQEMDEETEKRVISYEEVLVEKLWRLYCHKDITKTYSSLFQSSEKEQIVSSNNLELPENSSAFALTSSFEKLSHFSTFTQLYYRTPIESSSSSSFSSCTSSSASSSPSTGEMNLITPRSMRAWIDFLQEGMMPSKYISFQLHSPLHNIHHSPLRGANPKNPPNQAMLQIRNQMLLNDVAFSKGPSETNDTYEKFNFFDNKYSKDLIKKLLLFHEMDSIYSDQHQKKRIRRDLEDDNDDNNDDEEVEDGKDERQDAEEKMNVVVEPRQKSRNGEETLENIHSMKAELQRDEQYLQNEYDVANLLVGMQNEFQGNTRENVTMSASLSQSNSYVPSSSFPASSFTSSSWPRLHDTSSKLFSKLAQEDRNNPVSDETFAILNHLQSITEQTLALQMRLKQEYVRKQQEVFQVNSSEVITFGEISLVKELKIANDNLRWRLEQKNLLLQKNKEIITNAALQLKVVEEKNKELEKKNISLSLQVQQFKQQVQQLQQQQQQKQQQQGSSSTLLTSDSDETNHNGQQAQQENSASAEEGRGARIRKRKLSTDV